MCLNCGCMMPDNDMGNPDNLTIQDLTKAAKAGGNRNIKEVMENVIKTYNSQIKGKPIDTQAVK